MLGITQVLLAQYDHQIKTRYYKELKVLEEERHLLNLLKSDLSKVVNEEKIISFARKGEFELVK